MNDAQKKVLVVSGVALGIVALALYSRRKSAQTTTTTTDDAKLPPTTLSEAAQQKQAQARNLPFPWDALPIESKRENAPDWWPW